MVQNLQPDPEISLLADKLVLKGFARVNFRNPFFIFQNFYAIIVRKGKMKIYFHFDRTKQLCRYPAIIKKYGEDNG